MQLYVKVLPVRAGTAEPVGEPLMQPCPSDVGPDTVLSFITGILGEPAGTAWTSSDRHPRFTIGWIFSGLPDIDTDEPVEFICMTYVQADDGSMQSLFELMADQRQEFGQLAADGAFSSYTVIQQPHREYRQESNAGGAIPGPDADAAGDPDERAAGAEGVHETLSRIGRETGATLHAYPRPGPAVRTIVLRDMRGDRGSQREVVQIEHDGTVRIIARDQGPGVTEFFGPGITSYEWIYTIAPDRVDTLAMLAGGGPGQDPLQALASYYRRTNGQISDLLENPQVDAEFSNWHS